MASFLGFKLTSDTEETDPSGLMASYFDENSRIWGNNCGSSMFASKGAFSSHPAAHVDLKLIATHWYKVAARLQYKQL
jgi:hypothetical protein